MGPREQSAIILECMRIEMQATNQGGGVTINAGTPDAQHFEIRPSVNKLKRYLVEAQWWAAWCDYSNFDQKQLYMDQLKNTLSPRQTNRRYDSTAYVRPTRIENEGLLEQRGSSEAQASPMRRLRANLVEHYDFEAVFPTVWAHLYSWYSADTQIARYYKVDESLVGAGEDVLLGSMGHNTL